MSAQRLINLESGDKFRWRGALHTVFAHEGNMTEVYSRGRFWAWPSFVFVHKLIEPNADRNKTWGQSKVH